MKEWSDVDVWENLATLVAGIEEAAKAGNPADERRWNAYARTRACWILERLGVRVEDEDARIKLAELFT